MPERLNDGEKERRYKSRLGETSGIPSQEEQITPEQRTAAFFNQDVLALAKSMQGRLIVSQEDRKMIRVDNPEGWTRDKVGKRYAKGENLRLMGLTPGALGVFPLPVRRMRQSLISAKSDDELGACVRLVRASRYDAHTQEFVPMSREGDIANYFELEDNEAVRLRFVDESEILYFNRGEDNGVRIQVPTKPEKGSEAETANQYLRDLVNQ